MAQRIAKNWKPAAIYTSSLQRCVVTGGRIAKACGVGTATLDGLMDIDYGAGQMRIQDEIKAEAPELFQRWRATPQRMRFPGGESLQDLVARTADVLRLGLERHAEETAVLVGHDSVNRAPLLQLLDQPLSAYWRIAQSPCRLNEVDIGPGGVRVERVNDTSHLERP